MHRVNASADALSQLPEATGCYWFENAEGTVMYVGKSVCIRKRVASYFQRLNLTDPRESKHKIHSYIRKLETMVRFIKTIGYEQTETELDALLLEHSLIKKYRPMYNEAMRHDRKSWFITISPGETFPPLLSEYRDMREPITNDESDGRVHASSGYDIGPFYNEYTLKEALDVITGLWQLPHCGKSYDNAVKAEPCLRFHTKQCLAPCTREADPNEHLARLAEAAGFFQGNKSPAQKRVARELEQCTENMDFERAAKIRDAYATLNLWAHRLSKHPIDWRARYVVFAKTHREDRFMAAYAEEAEIKCWLYIDQGKASELSDKIKPLVRYAVQNDNTSELCFPVSREEGGQRWTALADISAVKHYIKLPIGENETEDDLLRRVNAQSAEFINRL
ncbi:MAG: UvrB/UvrC motif-containing protein [Defluviitaleaceae bacterium]|nr:UvrB/UvrC motif-containing protein [Defluviitaleaceae bacterium]